MNIESIIKLFIVIVGIVICTSLLVCVIDETIKDRKYITKEETIIVCDSIINSKLLNIEIENDDLTIPAQLTGNYSTK